MKGGNSRPLNLATFISNFGDGMHTLAIGQILFDRTGAVTSFGIVIALNYLIGIVCQIYAGHLADLLKRSSLVKSSDLARGILVIGLALAVGAAAPICWIVGISLLIKVGTQIYRPSYQAMISEAVGADRLSAFNSANAACMQGGQLLGMAAFGLLFRFGPAWVFLVDASTFFVSAAIVHRLKISSAAREESKSAVRSWIEAYRFVRGEKGLLLHIVISASVFLIYPIVELSVVPINALRFGGDKTWLAILNGVFSAGCILSMWLMKRWKDEEHAWLWMLAQAILLGVFALSGSSGSLAIAIYLGLGLVSTLASIQLLNRLMARSPRAFQGRVSALRYLTIAIMISAVMPVLTSTFTRSLDTGLLCSAGALLAFALLAAGASLRGSFLGDATVLCADEKAPA